MRIVATVVVAFLVAGEAGAGDYHWPMDAPPALTSTFGEYRPGRFHAGLDIKTWGREGYPVLAVADGYVWRVRTSPWGYGKAVYVKLGDGRTAVYAHLSDFAPRIRTYVEAEQERRGTYSVNLFLKRGQVPVVRGEAIGFSGSTGTGVPHLHFELRDEAQRPMNALMHGFEVADTVAPTPRSVALVPMDADSRAAAGCAPYVLGMRWHPEQKRYLSARQVMVEGRIGVAVDVFDRADASLLTNRLAPASLRLLVDGQEVFRTVYTVFGYERVNQVELDRNFALRRRGAGIFHNLFRAPGNRLPLYGEYRTGDGILHAGAPRAGRGVPLAPGPHRLLIVAEDVAGNRAEAEVDVLVNARPRVLDARAEAAADTARISARLADGDGDSLRVTFEASVDSGASWQVLDRRRAGARGAVSGAFPFAPGALYRIRARDPHGGEGFQTCAPSPSLVGAASGEMLACTVEFYPDFAVLRILADRPLAGPPRVMVREPAGGEAEVAVAQRSLLDYEAVVRFDPEMSGQAWVTVAAAGLDGEAGHQTLGLDRQRVSPSGGAVRSGDGMAEARFDSNGVYRTLFGRVAVEKGSGPDGLPLVGLAYRFMPDDVPFREKAELALRYPAGFARPERLGAYELQADSTWKFVDNRLDPERGTVSARVPHFSTYALLLDEVPPEVRGLRPEQGAETADRRPRLSATVRDSGSGIWREEDLQMALDGRPLIVVYDPEEERITALPGRPLQPGEHLLEVTVRDICGNEARASSRFTVR